MNDALKQTIDKIKSKDFTIYFFTVDTKDTPLASVEYMYAQAHVLKTAGYNTKILYEAKDGDYTPITWIGKYEDIEHVSSKKEGLELSTSDIIVIPELFTSLMYNLKDYPCHKIILSQSWKNITAFLGKENPADMTAQFNTNWQDTFKITNVITTSKDQSEYITDLFFGVKTEIVEPYIDNYQSKINGKKPFIGIMGRYDNHVERFIKSFYLKYPNFKWITFKNLRQINKENYLKELDECCVAVWLDRDSSFGTFPLESMKVNVPVVGLVPDLIPEWMINGEELKNNGIWLSSELKIHSAVGNYISMWLEGNIPKDLLDSMKETVKGKFSFEIFEDKTLKVYEGFINKRLKELELYEKK